MLIGAVFTANFIPHFSEIKLIYTDFIASPSQMKRDIIKASSLRTHSRSQARLYE